MAVSVLFPQHVLLHFAHGVNGQLLGEEHALGNLEAGDGGGLDHRFGQQVSFRIAAETSQ